MGAVIISGVFSLFWWAVFFIAFHKERSRYRNCYLLFFALLSLVPFILNVAGDYGSIVFVILINAILIGLLIVPFFLIFNGVVMIRKEGRQLSHLLSLALGIVILIGEVAFAWLVISYSLSSYADPLAHTYHSGLFIASLYTSMSVIYGSMAFLIFIVYTLFLQIIPKKKDFDYVIIHGAGLLEGDRISKLLRDRLDKAVKVYRKDPTPPKMIPSGGKGADESISEAEAMKKYLLETGIPEEDILMEDASATTLENLQNSKMIIDAAGSRAYTALVTSNYHVYRALRYCRRIGLTCTGIGSRVAFYYWPSALIREFIAIHAEKKHAAIFLGGWLLLMGIISVLLFA